MSKCSILYCYNNRSNVTKKDDISFHRFPNDPLIRQKWIDATGRPRSWRPTPRSTICSVHFQDNCFLGHKRNLCIIAVPTINVLNINESVREPTYNTVTEEPRISQPLLNSSEPKPNQSPSTQPRDLVNNTTKPPANVTAEEEDPVASDDSLSVTSTPSEFSTDTDESSELSLASDNSKKRIKKRSNPELFLQNQLKLAEETIKKQEEEIKWLKEQNRRKTVRINCLLRMMSGEERGGEGEENEEEQDMELED